MNIINLPSQASFQTDVLNAKVPTIAIFSATWCGPCKLLKETLKEAIKDLESEPNNSLAKIKFIVIDVDEYPELASSYNIRSVPTIMLFNNNELKEEIKGALSKAKLLELIKKYI